uniref:Phenylalanine--tRNA ligase beta subunit B1 domain-containing protein n=1 Tax=Timema shepardi TaxID=629360 RepID=A0A7R9G1U6_TIMSH|nr:unnamed protein product [Timema shepardi]
MKTIERTLSRKLGAQRLPDSLKICFDLLKPIPVLCLPSARTVLNVLCLAETSSCAMPALRPTCGGPTHLCHKSDNSKMEGCTYRKCTRICVKGEWKTILKKPPSQDSNLHLPDIGSLVYCEGSELDHGVTEAGDIIIKRCVTYCFTENVEAPGIELEISGSVARNSVTTRPRSQLADEEFNDLCFEFGLELDEVWSPNCQKRKSHCPQDTLPESRAIAHSASLIPGEELTPHPEYSPKLAID